MRYGMMCLCAALLGCAAAGDDLIVNVDPDAVTGAQSQAPDGPAPAATLDTAPRAQRDAQIGAGAILVNASWRYLTVDAFTASVLGSAQFGIANNNGHPITCSLRFQLVDAEGLTIGEISERAVLDPLEQVSIPAGSITEVATGFRFNYPITDDYAALNTAARLRYTGVCNQFR